jgi:hypothetical protein
MYADAGVRAAAAKSLFAMAVDLVVQLGYDRAGLERLVGPLARSLQEELRACGEVRLAARFAGGSQWERVRTFLSPIADGERIVRALAALLEGTAWPAPLEALSVVLGQLQDAGLRQLSLFGEEARREKLRAVTRYLSARFGAARLRRAVLAQPDAPLPEWRAGWLSEEEGS